MKPHEYQALTDRLQRSLEGDARVIGLMAAGSMARLSHQPDEWSDHDFWVIVQPGSESWFIEHHDWLPDSDQLVLFFRHAVHGSIKAVYASGHLLEFAVSGRQELFNAKLNDYHLLIDRAELAATLAQIRANTEQEHKTWLQDDLTLMGEFITNLLVGVWRCRRGEYLSGRQFITFSSLYSLLRLIPKHIPSDHPEVLDNIDPLRRFELAYPGIGQEINHLLQLDPEQAAAGLLDLADTLLRHRLTDYPAEAVAVIRRQIMD